MGPGEVVVYSPRSSIGAAPADGEEPHPAAMEIAATAVPARRSHMHRRNARRVPPFEFTRSRGRRAIMSALRAFPSWQRGKKAFRNGTLRSELKSRIAREVPRSVSATDESLVTLAVERYHRKRESSRRVRLASPRERWTTLGSVRARCPPGIRWRAPSVCPDQASVHRGQRARAAPPDRGTLSRSPAAVSVVRTGCMSFAAPSRLREAPRRHRVEHAHRSHRCARPHGR
jgi:hypothetical protein